MIRRARLYALATLLAVLAASCHHHQDDAGVTGSRSLVMENTSHKTGSALRN